LCASLRLLNFMYLERIIETILNEIIVKI